MVNVEEELDQDTRLRDVLQRVADRHPDIAHHFRHIDIPHRSRDTGFRDLFFEDDPSDFRHPIPARYPDPSPDCSSRKDQATQTGGLLQYGLRNTIDLGQKSSLSEENRNRRAMSAPPEVSGSPDRPADCDGRAGNETSGQPTVRHIPIFVEGRDRPVVNVDRDPGPEPARCTPPRDEAFFRNHDLPSGFRQPSHFAKAFGDPFSGFSRRRNVSPFQNVGKNFQSHPEPEQRFQQARPPPSEPERTPPKFKQNKEPDEAPPPRQPQRDEQIPAPQEEPDAASEQPRFVNDPITKIQAIQRDVLELMTKVENFKGSKKDKEYIYLDEMLTRNLIKLDDIETEGKENIRLARREAIKCIQKCIAVMEAKAEKCASSNNTATETEVGPSAAEDFREQVDVAANRQSAYDNVEASDTSALATEPAAVTAATPSQ